MTDERHKVLLANQDKDELAELADLVREAGHEVTDLAISVGEAGDAIIENKPTMAMILIEEDEEHALDLMAEINSFAGIPLVILARDISDRSLREAADQSLEVLHMPGSPETVGQVIDLAAKRFQDRVGLERRLGEMDGVLERRSTIEQAKGILMERHGIDSVAAFNLIREHARANQLRVADVAASVVTARELLSAGPATEPV
ncbi:MAG TPA: ANTAR domain-containing protein [Solirubrobacterales bacterium]|nr:ANTAR domain-containing protein [Solirubrobacterales bacterium]